MEGLREPDHNIGRGPTATPQQSGNQILEMTFNGLKAALTVLKETPDGPVGGVITNTAGLLLAVMEIAENVKGNIKDARELKSRLESLGNRIIEPLQRAAATSGTQSDDLEERWRFLDDELRKLEEELSPLQARSWGPRLLSHAADKQALSNCNARLDGIIGSATLEAAVATEMKVEQTRRDVRDLATKVDGLPEQLARIVGGSQIETMLRVNAQYNSSLRQGARRCHQGTRVGIIETIDCWIDGTGPHKEPIFWLSGEAGTGKSTIAHTIAEDRDTREPRQLGASYFFARNEDLRRDAKLFISTVAYQLSAFDKGFKANLEAALEENPTLPDCDIKTQLKEMIMEPLKKTPTLTASTIVVVVDALDECSPDTGAEQILNAWAELIKGFPQLFRLLITSRPSWHIKAKFEFAQHPSNIFHLHDISTTIVESDIKRYLRESLTGFPDGEPSDADLERLSRRVGLLFILAATYVKYIMDPNRNDPPSQLRALLSDSQMQELDGQPPEAELDRLYLDIVTSIPRDSKTYDAKDRMIDAFKKVVTAMIVAGIPMTPLQLADFLGMEERDVLYVLGRLSSVIYLRNKSAPASFYHQSFSEFLTNWDRCINHRYAVDRSQAHLWMALKCLDAFDNHLQDSPESDIPRKNQKLLPFGNQGLRLTHLFARGTHPRVKDHPALENHQADDAISSQESKLPETFLSLSTANNPYPPPLRYACVYFPYHLQGLMVQGETSGDCICLKRFENFYTRKRTQWQDVIASFDIPGLNDLPVRLHGGYIKYYQSQKERNRSILDQMVSFHRKLLPDLPPFQQLRTPSKRTSAVNGLRVAMKLLKESVDLIPVPGLSAAVSGVTAVIDIVEGVPDDPDLASLSRRITSVAETVGKSAELYSKEEVSAGSRRRVEAFLSDLEVLMNEVEAISSDRRNRPWRTLLFSEINRNPITDINTRIDRLITQFAMEGISSVETNATGTRRDVHAVGETVSSAARPVDAVDRTVDAED